MEIKEILDRASEEAVYKKKIPGMVEEQKIKEGNRELSEEFDFPWL
jgi:hypothetical protein